MIFLLYKDRIRSHARNGTRRSARPHVLLLISPSTRLRFYVSATTKLPSTEAATITTYVAQSFRSIFPFPYSPHLALAALGQCQRHKPLARYHEAAVLSFLLFCFSPPFTALSEILATLSELSLLWKISEKTPKIR